jgi:alkylation response protein AidB-like acyl-CoA dehydrogenase
MTDLAFDHRADEALVQRARDMVPFLASKAAQHEDAAEISDEAKAALLDMGALKMAVPRRWGGLGTSCRAMANVAAELAKGCPSTAWVVGVMNSNAWLASNMPDRVQEEVFGEGASPVCGVSNPPGSYRPEGNSYLINGRWGYGSGSHLAEWAYLPVVGPNREDGVAMMRMSELTVDHTWKVAGMRATGSDTLVVKDGLVAENRFATAEEMFGPASANRRHAGEVTDYWTPLPLLRAKAIGVLLGIAEGILETTISSCRDKPLAQTTYAHKKDSHVFQAGIGEAGGRISAARMLMDQTTRMIDDAACARQLLDVGQRSEIRVGGAIAIDLLQKAVDQLMNLAGSSAFTLANPIQRYWRDFSVGSRHAALSPGVGFEVHGRQLLGVDPNIVPQAMI